ncbi:ABC transporter ATP-binding protein [Ethanoligenens sp.]|uniref:ABC transporter ATP-binding protein n=1 Tax=Ethanoligenens sp. TaxID=2099655 RepID=UPI0039E8B56E
MEDIVLKTTRLKKTIGKRTIVSDINLELHKGEIFGFLGPNGAGKSTTIKMIVGLSTITDGNIFIDGHSVRTEFKHAMQRLGCIVENPDLYKYMSGLDNLRLFAKMYDNVDDARIADVVRIVDLTAAIKKPVKTYSLGMKQRLGIAQALLHSPSLLILDEPTNGLDPAGIHDLRELLGKLRDETGLTVLVSSHILAEMQQMCDRVGIINKGRIITTKTVDELLQLANAEGDGEMLLKTDAPEKAVQALTETGFTAAAEKDGVHLKIKREQVPQVLAAMQENNLAVYGIENRAGGSLEDIFMKLTGEGK